MILSFDLWHDGWGFSISLIILERFVLEEIINEFTWLGFDSQVKAFGRIWDFNRELTTRKEETKP